MSRHVLDARELKDGEIFDAGETLRMRISKIYRIRHECAARAECGRSRPAATRAPPPRPRAGTHGAGGCGRTRSCG